MSKQAQPLKLLHVWAEIYLWRLEHDKQLLSENQQRRAWRLR